ncbi:MAG: thiamine pyrophosphate-dependent enzyme [Bacillota bacterium]|nr:thiamine pyrophosphate-dependent enzyme [Bacillota bacterium]
MNKLYEKYIKKESLPTLFCPGCGNGIIQRAAIEAIDNLGCRKETACVSGIGCSSWIPCYLQMDAIHTMHGRALPFAEGLKLSQPDKKILVFTGDGDCMAIGGNHLLHAAARNIDLTVVMVNNNIYGMTGGQKSPTTPLEAKTKTSPFGCIDMPMDACALVMTLGASYVARWTTAHPVQLAKAIAEGLLHKGFAFIDVLSQCPVQAGKSIWGEKDPAKIMKMYKEHTYMVKEGEFDPAAADRAGDKKGKIPIGLFRNDPDAPEYLEKVKAKLSQCGIK